ncbi:hypothetical protein ACFPAG_14510 [Vogesella sp. GCM10023246]|uniref:Uncharacterized protein n=1 Tax=Vogesella oryzagri TaxID=3160864 RepID=A0ABV1M6H4_9NEIS
MQGANTVTQHHVDSLDRLKAIEFLDASWLNAMALPEELKLFGVTSQLAIGELAEALRQFQQDNPGAEILFWPEGELSDWDIPVANSLFAQLRHGLSFGYKLSLMLPTEHLTKLDEGSRRKLLALTELGLSLFTTSAKRLESKQLKLAVLARSTQGVVHAWAVNSNFSLVPDESWGQSQDGIHVIEGRLDGWPALATVVPDALQLNAQQDQQLIVQSECNGALQGFGSRLWGYLCSQTPKLAALLNDEQNAITAISYSDRYLRSPLVLALLLEFLYALGKTPAGEKGLPTIDLRTSTFSRPHITATARNSASQFRHHDWSDEEIRNQVLTGIFEYAGLAMMADPVVGKIPHARELFLSFASGEQVRICLDQGVSYWATAGREFFDFHASIDQQIDAVANMSGSVFGYAPHATLVFIKFL